MSRVISSSRRIDAPAATIFDVLADPHRHHEIDGSDTVGQPNVDSPDRLSLGAKFTMSMKLGPLPYRITNTVVEYEENKRIAWKHLGGHIWRFALDAQGDVTLITESFDYRNTPVPRFYEMVGYTRSHASAMARTLANLDVAVTGQLGG